MEKKTLDLGEAGNWCEDQKAALKGAILEMYSFHYPVHIQRDLLLKSLLSSYEIKGSKGNIGISSKISDLFKDEPFRGPFISNEKLLVLPEFYPMDRIDEITGIRDFLRRNGDKEKQYRNRVRKLLLEKDSYSYTKSGIWVRQISGDNGPYVVFSYPRIPTVDYAGVFYEIFQCENVNESISKDRKLSISKKRCENNNADFSTFWIDSCFLVSGNAVDINLSKLTGKNHTTIMHSAYYIIDFIVSFLASDLATTAKGKQGDKGNIKKALTKLQRSLGYSSNQFLENRILEKVSKKVFNGNAERLCKILIKISKDSTSKNLHLPQYHLYMPTVFELYAFSLLKKEFKSLRYKTSVKGRDRIPDMIDRESKIILDAKYKLEYISERYCDIEDADRMAQYLLGEEDGYTGVFVYPDTRSSSCETIKDRIKEAKNKTKKYTHSQYEPSVIKIGFPLPFRDSIPSI